MTNQSNTTVRELNLEDLDRVSGAGIKVPEHGMRKAGGDASLDYPPGPSAPDAMRGLVGPDV